MTARDNEDRGTLLPGDVHGIMWMFAGASILSLALVYRGFADTAPGNLVMSGVVFPVLSVGYWALAGPNRAAPLLRLAATIVTISSAASVSLVLSAESAVAYLPLLALFASSDALSRRRRRRMLGVYFAATVATLFVVVQGPLMGQADAPGHGAHALLAAGIVAAVAVTFLTGRDFDRVELGLGAVALVLSLTTLVAVDTTAIGLSHVLVAALFVVPALGEAWAGSVDRSAWSGST